MLHYPSMTRTSAFVVAAIFAAPILAAAQTTAVVGARLIDGRGGVIENGTLVIRDGRIVAAGPAAQTTVPAGAERVDAAGATIIPGLINAHGHLTSAVGMRSEKAGAGRDNLVRQLRTYAQYGVTTVYSLGEDADVAETVLQLRNEQRAGTLQGARLFISGPVIGGNTAEAARATTDTVAASKPDVLKIRIDDNLGSGRKMPEDAWRATIARANELKLPIAVHIFYLSDARAALAAGADIIAHSVRDVPVDDAFVRELKARNACYTPTLTRELSTFVYGSTPPWARDPFFLKGATPGAADEITDPARQKQVQGSNAYKQGLQYKEGLEVAKKNLQTLHDAGVRVAMGTDSGPPGRWQGFFEHLELEMMVESGLTPMQAIVSATGAAAECHGKAGEIGTLQAGAAADFVVLTANPLDDIRNTRQIRSVWIAGREVK
jgi:imidazolonepropionase-like amidohydrolase